MSKNKDFKIELKAETLVLLLDSLPEPTFIVDQEGIIRIFNKAYEKLLDVKRHEVIGKHVKEVMPNTRIPNVLKSGKPELGELMGIRGLDAIVQRIPVIKDGEAIGAIARVSFRNMSELQKLLKKVTQLQQQVEDYKQELRGMWSPQYQIENIIGESGAIKQAKELTRKIALSDSNALILGESGSGKEMFAHALHAASSRSEYPFICVNCAAIPKDLVESELFGYERGAFTGADRIGKPGKFEMAHEGSLFLDEIGDMPLEIQPKILRVLESNEVERIGSTRPKKVNVRVIVATHHDLEKMVKDRLFRNDLFYRLNIATIKIPPLREHREDMPLLVKHLLEKLHRTRNLELKSVEDEILDLFQTYHWPGNVRELSNLLERLMNEVEGSVIRKKDIPGFYEKKITINTTLDNNINLTEKKLVSQALIQTGGNKKRAAKLLGIHRSTLYDKLKKHGLNT
jgi:PAS domain S-box-containing protein